MTTRWDFSKSRSNYHFDPTINEDDNPPFKIIGRVEGDLAFHLQDSLKRFSVRANGFKNRLSVQNNRDIKPFTHDYDEAELAYLGLSDDHAFFDNVKVCPKLLYKLRTQLGFMEVGFGGGFHIQHPGQLFPFHVDELPNIRGNDPDHWSNQKPESIARLEIMVHDWQPGHVWAYGNTYWKQWKAGDIAWHDWRNTPHATANIGRSDRVTLQLTGWTTEQTRQIIRDGNVSITL
jgi:hypothetical protein